jgi:hypothetical protein
LSCPLIGKPQNQFFQIAVSRALLEPPSDRGLCDSAISNCTY